MFTKKSKRRVADVVAALTRTITDLESLSKENLDEAERIQTQINDLETQVGDCVAESTSATRIADNLRKLVS